MSYLRRNIRDLTSKLIAANGGELSDTMKEALSDFSARLLFIGPLDDSERKQKAHAKRQRRRDQRRKANEAARNNVEEWHGWLNFQEHEENDRYGEYEYAGVFFAGTNALEWMDDESLRNWEQYLSGQWDDEPEEFDYDFYGYDFYGYDNFIDSSCHYSDHWWVQTPYCCQCGEYVGR